MSIDVARRILEASKQRAKELRSPVSIAIVDEGGHLVLFERMMSPYGWATGNISIAKATTAVMFNQSTDAVAQWGAGIPGFASSLATMTEGKFIMAAGGWPIKLNGATIGGIGVSGGNAPGRDDEIARVGLGALEAFAPPISAQQQPVQPQIAPSAVSQQHSRPYVQPIPSYPSMPPVPPVSPVPSVNNAPTPSLNSGSFPSSSNSGNLANPPASGGVGQPSNVPPSTQNFFPEQPRPEENSYYNDADPLFYDNHPGGQQ